MLQVQRGKLEACDAASIFKPSTIIVAGEHAEQKPHASIFLTACDAMGEAPGATLMVGDNYEADIAGALFFASCAPPSLTIVPAVLCVTFGLSGS